MKKKMILLGKNYLFWSICYLTISIDQMTIFWHSVMLIVLLYLELSLKNVIFVLKIDVICQIRVSYGKFIIFTI